MVFVPLKCSQCGSIIKVDVTKEKGICEHCGTEFITEKTINNNVYNNTTNIEKQTNIYFGENKFEEEKKQCKILLTMLENYDFSNIKDRALKVLDYNPENELAIMLYNCNFTTKSYIDGDFPTLNFDERPVCQYFYSRKGLISTDFSLLFIDLLLLEAKNSAFMVNLFDKILDNIDNLGLDKTTISYTYNEIAKKILNKNSINRLRKCANQMGGLAVLNIFLTGSAYVSTLADLQADEAKSLLNLLKDSRRDFCDEMLEHLDNIDIDDEIKDDLRKNLELNSSNSSIPHLIAKISFISAAIFVAIIMIILIISFIMYKSKS